MFQADELLLALRDAEVRFVVIGGIAVGVHGYVRATKDLDIVPDPRPENLTRLASLLRELDAAHVGVGEFSADEFPYDPTDPAQLAAFQQAQGQLGSALSRLLVVSENYPQLRATENFRDLQAQLEGTENRIAVERANFNQAVQAYDTAIRRFPGVIIAGMFKFSERPYFTAAAGAETVPKVDFSGKF